MSCTKPRQQFPGDQQQRIVHERRRRAAWFDYLQTVQESSPRQYDEIEQAAWSRLQRRLERNDERSGVHLQPAD